MTDRNTGNAQLFEFMDQLAAELYRRYQMPGPINPEAVLLAVANAIAEVRRKMTE